MSAKQPVLLMVYGEGGHKAQANRIVDRMGLADSRIVSLSDDPSVPEWSDEHLVIPSLRQKHQSFGSIGAAWQSLWRALRFIRKNKVTGMISTGPGVAIVPALVLRCMGCKVVHIETWSRFYTRSMAGRVMYRLANRFYYQNETLAQLYPKGIYGGRL